MKKRVIAFLVVGMIVVALAGCGGGASNSSGGSNSSGTTSGGTTSGGTTAGSNATTSDDVIELKFVAPSNAHGGDILFWDAWRKFLWNESGGKLLLTEYGGGALVPEGEELAAIRNGLADMGKIDSQFAAGEITLNQAVCLPATVDWPGALQSALLHMELYSEFPEMQAEFEKNGVKFLFPLYGGPTNVQTTKKPIHTLEDLKGLNQIEIGAYASEAAKLLGMNPLSFPITENADALMKGVADGIDLNYNAVGNYYIDSINYSTQTGLVQPSTIYICFNPDKWNSLPADIQELFNAENIAKVCLVANYLRDKGDINGAQLLSDKYAKNGLPEIYILPEDELTKWKEIVAPVKDIWIKDAGGELGQKIQDRLAEISGDYKYTDARAAAAEAQIAEWLNLPEALPNPLETA